ncbi:threonine transporter RhtB [Catellatospora sp. TT07R-123]|uniref:LysE family translocator n=1 Tax=Catellatospora sp. TT07R-123 TaxID=2733863 RepID=UPI001B07F94A|nr:LysE family translocator [Catellatospora sp. TT07R-123]GHJ48183.1 threonine transporter RhtB [Catellatospora sp. TT07R-123]
MAPQAVAGFLLAVLPLVATPGASLALLTQRVTAGGARHAAPVVLGTLTGLYVHAALAVAGLSALVMHSSRLFTAVRLAGAAYLVVLGVLTWRGPRPGTGARIDRQRSAYWQALLGNVLNPKAASIYLTLVPQFVDPRRSLAAQVFTLATAHALLMVAWLGGWTALLRRARRALAVSGLAAVTRRLAAVVLIGLGVRAAV